MMAKEKIDGAGGVYETLGGFLVSNGNCSILNLRDQEIYWNNPELCKNFAIVLEQNPMITSINFSSTRMSNQALQALVPALASLRALQTLDLSNNNLDNDVASAIANLIISSKKLSLLELHINYFGNGGAEIIAMAAINSSSALKKGKKAVSETKMKITLSENKGLTKEYVEDIKLKIGGVFTFDTEPLERADDCKISGMDTLLAKSVMCKASPTKKKAHSNLTMEEAVAEVAKLKAEEVAAEREPAYTYQYDPRSLEEGMGAKLINNYGSIASDTEITGEDSCCCCCVM